MPVGHVLDGRIASTKGRFPHKSFGIHKIQRCRLHQRLQRHVSKATSAIVLLQAVSELHGNAIPFELAISVMNDANGIALTALQARQGFKKRRQSVPLPHLQRGIQHRHFLDDLHYFCREGI